MGKVYYSQVTGEICFNLREIMRFDTLFPRNGWTGKRFANLRWRVIGVHDGEHIVAITKEV